MAKNYNTPILLGTEDLRSKSFDMLIALTPVLIFAVWTHGAPALREMFLSVFACVMSQWLFRYFMKKPLRLTDGTAVVTGLMLACCLPPNVPVYVPLLGGAFAQIMVVELFGGYGNNFVNPALAAQGFLLVSFSTVMSTNTVDAISVATPLVRMADGQTVDLLAMFLNKTYGTVGDISALCILIGFAYLLIRRRINPIVPAVSTGVFALCLGLFSGHGFDGHYILGQILGGGFLFLVCFFSSDPVTTPRKASGKLIFGIVFGALYAVFRVFGKSPENGSYALLFVMLLTPLLDIMATGSEKKLNLRAMKKETEDAGEGGKEARS